MRLALEEVSTWPTWCWGRPCWRSYSANILECKELPMHPVLWTPGGEQACTCHCGSDAGGWPRPLEACAVRAEPGHRPLPVPEGSQPLWREGFSMESGERRALVTAAPDLTAGLLGHGAEWQLPKWAWPPQGESRHDLHGSLEDHPPSGPFAPWTTV